MSIFANIVRTPFRILLALIKLVVGLVVVVALAIAGINAYEIGTTASSMVTAEQAKTANAEAIVVLGASVLPDGEPSDILRDRLDDAAVLYQEGAAREILVSGASTSDGYCEAIYMKEYLVDVGIPEDVIVCDFAGYSTYETMYRAHFVFNYNDVIVATQEYHLPRSVYCAQGLGMKAIGVAAGVGHTYDDQGYYNIREIGSRTKDFFQVAMKVPPTDSSATTNLAKQVQ